MLVVATVTILAVLVTIVMPGYTSPMSRLYTSKFGYGSVLRKLHRPFPVTATRPVRRVLGRISVGEGLVRSEPIVVAIVPMGIIKRLYVRTGDQVEKGQLLAEVDSTKAEIKVGAARAALETAKAELERVRIGSAYVLANERPERDKIRLDTAEREFDIQKKLQEMNLRLADKGYAIKQDILRQDLLLTQAQSAIREMKFNLGMSQARRVAERRDRRGGGPGRRAGAGAPVVRAERVQDLLRSPPAGSSGAWCTRGNTTRIRASRAS